MINAFCSSFFICVRPPGRKLICKRGTSCAMLALPGFAQHKGPQRKRSCFASVRSSLNIIMLPNSLAAPPAWARGLPVVPTLRTGGQALGAAPKRPLPVPSASRRAITASASAQSPGGSRITAATTALFAGGDTQVQLQRFKFLLAVNVLVPLPLGLAHLFAPAVASRVAWLGFAPPHPLLFPLLGSLWAAVGIVSALALLSRDPLKFRQATLLGAALHGAPMLHASRCMQPALLLAAAGALPCSA